MAQDQRGMHSKGCLIPIRREPNGRISRKSRSQVREEMARDIERRRLKAAKLGDPTDCAKVGALGNASVTDFHLARLT